MYKVEKILVHKEVLEKLFKDWLDTYQVISTCQWATLSTYEADILTEALWKDFYENYLLGNIEFKNVKVSVNERTKN